MKVAASAQQLLLELAESDAHLARLAHRINTLPEAAELKNLAEQLSLHRDDVVKVQLSAEDSDREISRLENEIATLTTRLTKDEAQLKLGTLPAKTLSDLQHELASLTRRRGSFEDELLDALEQREAVAAEEQRISALITHTENSIVETTEKRDLALAAEQANTEAVEQKRAEIVTHIEPELLALYTRRRENGSVGAGLLRAGRCGACRMELGRGTISEIRTAAPEEVIFCEECGAILVRTSESGLG